MATSRGTGSLRQRRPGVWEIRVAVGTDPVTGRTLQRSVMFRGEAVDAEAYRRSWLTSTAGEGPRAGRRPS